MKNRPVEERLWWVIPGVLAGMPMPGISRARRMNGGGALAAYDDQLVALHRTGIRAIVALLDFRNAAAVYEQAGFTFLGVPVPEGSAPTTEAALRFVRFVDEQRAAQRPVAVHCEAGLGRTGTLLAAYFIAKGETSRSAIHRIRSCNGAAIETEQQVRFLEQFARLPMFSIR